MQTYAITPVPAPRQTRSHAKCTDAEILHAYAEAKSVWGAAKLLGLCGQSVHERLQRLGASRPIRILSDAEKEIIREVYQSGILRGDGKLKALSLRINRTVPFISRYAKKVGLTTYNRACTAPHAAAQAERVKRKFAENGHPRGMLGKKHTPETLARFSASSIKSWASKTEEQKNQKTMKMLKTKKERGNLHNPRHKTTWKQGWYEIAGAKFYFRSSWEYNYALILEKRLALKIITKWEYEPDTFWFEAIRRGTRSYTPDFKVFWPDGAIEYHEVKGWMDDRSKTKLKRMKKYHPSVKIVLIDSKAYKSIIKRGI